MLYNRAVEPQPLTELLSRIARVRIGVLGDLMVDRFIYGDAQRISPEAPVPVVTIRERTTQPGGAANVANNVVSLGGRCSLFGILGDDPAGHEVRAMLVAEGCDVRGVLAPAGYHSTVKTRVVAQSQQLLRIDEEHAQPVDAQTSALLLAAIVEQLDELSVLVISDYAKGVLSRELAQQVIDVAAGANVPVVVDPKPSNMDFYAGADVVKPNLGEALCYVGREQATNDAMQSVCEQVREGSETKAVVITAGAHGSYIFDGATFSHLEGHARAVYDVAGAGDSTLAALALALGASADLVTAVALGNMAGSIAVGKLGVAAVTADEMRTELEAEHAAAR
jgi:D-beta-D-heptose 7-phosphate kinase / D-beta-D-heptose 1-phosphate adenosyltransferase